MELWLIWMILGIILFIVEIFTPFLFFLNLAIAAFCVAAAAYFGIGWVSQIVIFGVISCVLLGFLRPILMRNMSKENTSSSIDEKYLGKEAKVIKAVNAEDGEVTIYDEKWVAKSVDGSEIEVGAIVKIVRNDGSVFYVEKIG